MKDLFSADAATLFIMGQSNAHAHEQTLPESEQITVPLKNVHTLNRPFNQSFDNDHVEWSGFTSANYNLGETQDHTASLAYYTARAWQKAIDGGMPLPDLYIVQISIGGQGLFGCRDIGSVGMWNMDKPRILRPGALQEVNISLFQLMQHTLHLAVDDLRKQYYSVYSLGIHWIGSEQDAVDGICKRPEFDETYDRFFDALINAVGDDCPLALYQLSCTGWDVVLQQGSSAVDAMLDGIAAMNAIFERQCRRHPSAYIVSVKDCPFYNPDDPFMGIYAKDNVHYLAETQRWFSETLLRRNKGL